MSDIVDRLRDFENEGVTSSDLFHLRNEAAAEIEQLRALHDVDMKIVTGRNEALEEELVRLTAENDLLRTMLPKLGAPCAHCGITDIGKCVRGFPGCAQADDLMCGEDEYMRRLTASREALRAVLQELVLIDEDEPSMDSYRWPIWYNKRESAMYDAHKVLEQK